MFVTKKALSRRTFLRGAGATLALPFFDAMVPALSAAAKPTPRLGFIYIANGVIQKQWTPATTGALVELPPILQSLEPVKDHLNVISGLAHLQADTFGDGTGDHPRSSAAWLTGVHAYDRTQPGVEVRLATTADQLAARVIGKDTQLASLELTVDFPTQGSCDSGDCFYVNTVSWRNETTPNMAELHPRIVFERLFGDGGSAAQRQTRVRETGSILDSITDEVNALAKSLGRGDRSKLTEYLDSVREIEHRIQNTEAQGKHSIELPARPVDIPDSFDEYTKMMLDLVALAYQADITRVFSMIFARELSSRTFAHIGVPDQHHGVSHHRNDPEEIAKKARIDVYHAQLLSYFLSRLQSTRDGEGSLLDHSLILYGGGMGDGNLHRHFDLPCLLAGKLGGQLKTGRHLAFPDKTPMTNLLLTILDKTGAPIEKLGDSTGPLDLS
jgi:hypothetical protein